MPDDRKTPPLRSKSQWGATQRDLVGERYRAPDAVPGSFEDPVTGVVYDEAKRAEMRSKRSSEVRFDHIERRLDEADERDIRREKKHDELAKVVGDIHSNASGTTAQLTLLTGLVARAFESKNELGQLVVKAQTDVFRAESFDSIEGRKARRALIAKWLSGGVISGAGIYALLHKLGWL